MIQKIFFMMFLGFGMTLPNLSAQSLWSMDPIEVRNRINQKIMEVDAETPEVHNVIDKHVLYNELEIPIRIYTPNEYHNLPIALLIHGGGWVAGNLDTHDNMARYLCREAKIVIVSVGYTNSPEGKFPLPLEQCYNVLLWIFQEAQNLHIDTSKLTIIGDSAGGNMAAALCLLARDRNGPDIDLQVLINPVPDLTCGGTITEQGDSQDIMRWFATQYVANPADVNNPYVSPILANDLSGLPSAVVILAEKDELREEGLRYADRLGASGIPTITYMQHGIGHLGGEGARASKRAQESLNVAVEALRNTTNW